jgi:aryl-alcohol dehydrogenase-like predicted oxidoreductase
MSSHDKRVRIGGSDLSVFPLNLGGNVFGWTADEQQSFSVLDAYTAAGGDFIDTADVYSAWVPGNPGGVSETIIGRWLSSRGNRDEIVVATKVGRHADYNGLRPETIKAGAEASLRRLNTDYIDLYYTHYDDESVPVEEIITTLDGLVREGKVRYIAASNISAARLRASLEFSEREGLARYIALQPRYNLVSRDTYEGELAGVVAEHGLSTIPYFGLAAGFLTGKYRPGTTVESARNAGDPLKTERGVRVLDALDKVAAAHGVEPATAALAWLAAQPAVDVLLASARTPGQLPALIAATDLALTPEDLTSLDEASRV